MPAALLMAAGVAICSRWNGAVAVVGIVAWSVAPNPDVA